MPGSASGARYARPRFPRPAPFPPPPPPPPQRACSAASQVLRGCPTSHGRSSRAYRLSVPLAARYPPICHPRTIQDGASPTGTGDRGISRFPRPETCVHAPGLRPRGVRRPLAITRPATLPSASIHGVGTPEPLGGHDFAAQYPSLPVPLSTLHRRPHERRRMTRGHRGSLVLRCRAFSSPSPSRFIPAFLTVQSWG